MFRKRNDFRVFKFYNLFSVSISPALEEKFI